MTLAVSIASRRDETHEALPPTITQAASARRVWRR